MSLNRIVLRHAAVNAVANFFQAPYPTIAGKMIFDSKIEPVENIREDLAYPTVVIYTDYDKDYLPHQGQSHMARSMTVTFELLMAVIHEGKEAYTIKTPYTDAELESSLDALEWQVFAALRANNSAAECFRTIAFSWDSVVSRRGATVEGGTKIAARQVTLEARVIQEPAQMILQPHIQTFLEDLSNSPGSTKLSEEVMSLFRAPGDVPYADVLEQTMGWTRSSRELLGYPLPDAPLGVAHPVIHWLDPTGN